MPLLNGEQIRQFCKILCNFFTIEEITQMVRTRLNESLEGIVAVKARTKENIAFDLIEWLQHRGRTEELLQAVRDERSNVAEVTSYCNALLAHAVPSAPVGPSGANGPPDPYRVLVQVVEFRTLFGQRKKVFGYLNAYKTLHDVLHKLQDQKIAIVDAAQRFHRAPEDHLELKVIADKLEDELVSEAKAALPKTEFSEEAWWQWVTIFESTVANLRNCLEPPDLGLLDRSVQILGALYNQQAALNGELVRCAKRLDTNDLLETLEGILAALLQVPAAKSDDLRAGLTRFQGSCKSLAALILDHDACQKIETSLAAVPPDSVVASSVFQWTEIIADLLRIAARRPEDKRAARMAEYAKAFDAAIDPKAARTHFTLLREQFDRLFNKTDEDLLEVTDDLVTEADRLSIQLRGFTQ